MSAWAKIIGAGVNMVMNQQVADTNRHDSRWFAKKGTAHTIRQCMAFGIHPAQCMGVSPASGPVVPMQNPLSHISGALAAHQIDPDSGINRELKEHALREAKRQEKDSKWRNSILIPVSHPDLPRGKKIWAFNSRFAMFGALAQSIVLAKNAGEAMDLMMQKASPEQKQQLQKFRRKQFKEQWRKKEKQLQDSGEMIAP